MDNCPASNPVDLGCPCSGIFALAQRLYDQVTNIHMVPAYQVVQAGIARAQDDIGQAKQIAQGTLRVTSVVASPLSLGWQRWPRHLFRPSSEKRGARRYWSFK